MPNLEERFSLTGIEAGCDEAGRGCLAGPVVAAAVILPSGWNHPLLNDSKKLNETSRNTLRKVIESDFEHWAVGFVYPEEIDRINILNASFLAMHKALDQLNQKPDLILVDGNRFKPYGDIKSECIVKGDGKFRAIAAASILAKTYRDEYMYELGYKYPHYNWQSNKGYPTVKHRKAIEEYGPCEYHRMSFQLLPKQLELFEV